MTSGKLVQGHVKSFVDVIQLHCNPDSENHLFGNKTFGTQQY